MFMCFVMYDKMYSSYSNFQSYSWIYVSHVFYASSFLFLFTFIMYLVLSPLCNPPSTPQCPWIALVLMSHERFGHLWANRPKSVGKVWEKWAKKVWENRGKWIVLFTTREPAPLEAPGNSRTSEYSTACALYFSRRSVEVREPIDPTPNHEPGTSISTARSICSWPGYWLTNSIYLSIAVDIFVKPPGSPAPPLSRRCAIAPAAPPSLLPRL